MEESKDANKSYYRWQKIVHFMIVQRLLIHKTCLSWFISCFNLMILPKPDKQNQNKNSRIYNRDNLSLAKNDDF